MHVKTPNYDYEVEPLKAVFTQCGIPGGNHYIIYFIICVTDTMFLSI